MSKKARFELVEFLPYALNQAADALSLEFQHVYKGRYGMLRTEWRVLFHLGCYGEMTAKQVCEMGRLHKTKVSRAVAALESKRYLEREEVANDRRHSVLRLTKAGQTVFEDLEREARAFDARVRGDMNAQDAQVFQRALLRIAGLSSRD